MYSPFLVVAVNVACSLQKKYQTKNYSAQSIEAVKELDTVLTQLAVSPLCVI